MITNGGNLIELWSLAEKGGSAFTPEIAKTSLTKTESSKLLSRVVGISTYCI